MNIIAMAFISVGYVLFYWGANELVHWNRSVDNTEAATLKLLFGFPIESSYQTLHSVPFPFKETTTSSATTTPSGSNLDPMKPGSGAQLSPTFPGGPGGTIPTPKIPGTVTL